MSKAVKRLTMSQANSRPAAERFWRYTIVLCGEHPRNGLRNEVEKNVQEERVDFPALVERRSWFE